MATRSNIGMVNKDGSITAIYVHWDGYLEHVGNILLNHYNTVEIVTDLLKLGNLSVLAENLYPTEFHTFDKPQEGVCVAYDRDRGEKKQNAKVFKDLNEYDVMADNTGADYQYLYENGEWRYRNTYDDNWNKLTVDDCV